MGVGVSVCGGVGVYDTCVGISGISVYFHTCVYACLCAVSYAVCICMHAHISTCMHACNGAH